MVVINKLSDMLIRIKNGYFAKRNGIFVLYSKQNISVLNLLYKEGFINGFFLTTQGTIYVKLKYYRNDFLFKGYKIISTPGRRVYYNVFDLQSKFYNKAFVIVSTIEGLMLHKYAILKNLGGEVLFELEYC